MGRVRFGDVLTYSGTRIQSYYEQIFNLFCKCVNSLFSVRKHIMIPLISTVTSDIQGRTHLQKIPCQLQIQNLEWLTTQLLNTNYLNSSTNQHLVNVRNELSQLINQASFFLAGKWVLKLEYMLSTQHSTWYVDSPIYLLYIDISALTLCFKSCLSLKRANK